LNTLDFLEGSGAVIQDRYDGTNDLVHGILQILRNLCDKGILKGYSRVPFLNECRKDGAAVSRGPENFLLGNLESNSLVNGVNKAAQRAGQSLSFIPRQWCGGFSILGCFVNGCEDVQGGIGQLDCLGAILVSLDDGLESPNTRGKGLKIGSNGSPLAAGEGQGRRSKEEELHYNELEQ
jgi:hypothetical protein